MYTQYNILIIKLSYVVQKMNNGKNYKEYIISCAHPSTQVCVTQIIKICINHVLLYIYN